MRASPSYGMTTTKACRALLTWPGPFSITPFQEHVPGELFNCETSTSLELNPFKGFHFSFLVTSNLENLNFHMYIHHADL